MFVLVGKHFAAYPNGVIIAGGTLMLSGAIGLLCSIWPAVEMFQASLALLNTDGLNPKYGMLAKAAMFNASLVLVLWALVLVFATALFLRQRWAWFASVGTAIAGIFICAYYVQHNLAVVAVVVLTHLFPLIIWPLLTDSAQRSLEVDRIRLSLKLPLLGLSTVAIFGALFFMAESLFGLAKAAEMY